MAPLIVRHIVGIYVCLIPYDVAPVDDIPKLALFRLMQVQAHQSSCAWRDFLIIKLLGGCLLNTSDAIRSLFVECCLFVRGDLSLH